MTKNGTVILYSLDNAYTREQAAERLGVSKATVDRCIVSGAYTIASYPSTTNTYLLKDEVDYIAEKGISPASREVRDILGAFRRRKQIDSMDTSDDHADMIVPEAQSVYIESNSSSYWDAMKEYATALNRFGKMLERGITNAR